MVILINIMHLIPYLDFILTTILHFVNSLFPMKIVPRVVNLKKSKKKDIA
jgi:hypothetical protein